MPKRQRRGAESEADALRQWMAEVTTRACRCCMGRGWVLARNGRTRCWVCRGAGQGVE